MLDEKAQIHIPFRRGKTLTGTARYTSVNSHRGFEQSRRDDLESVGYILIYFAKHELPWQGVKANTKEQKYDKILESKANTSVETLCKGLPTEFATFFHYVKNLNFEDVPDYKYLKTLFRQIMKRNGWQYNFEYDWINMKKNNIVTTSWWFCHFLLVF